MRKREVECWLKLSPYADDPPPSGAVLTSLPSLLCAVNITKLNKCIFILTSQCPLVLLYCFGDITTNPFAQVSSQNILGSTAEWNPRRRQRKMGKDEDNQVRVGPKEENC